MRYDNVPMPDGWKWYELHDLATVISKGTTPTTLGHPYVDSGIPFLRAEDIRGSAVDVAAAALRISANTHEELSRSQLQPGDLLITIAGTLGRVGYVPFDAPPLNCNQAVAFVRPIRELVDVEFVCYLCQHRRVISTLMDLRAGGGIQNLNLEQIRGLALPIPSLAEQHRIVGLLKAQMAAIELARSACEAQIELVDRLTESYLTASLSTSGCHHRSVGELLVEVREGVGPHWKNFPVFGATRDGLAPAKEKVGKSPERYKVVGPGTVFYNPMRILIGSIAMVDDDDEPGITSPDYVVVRTKAGHLHHRWFYYWLRSSRGRAFVKSMARGAVRERMLFKRLEAGTIDVPTWEMQVQTAAKLKRLAKLARDIREQLATIEALPAGLLRLAFSGAL